MKICDRCKKPINIFPEQAITFPYYNINILYFNSSYSSLVSIDLCEDCKQKIIDFIKEGKDSE